MITGYDIRRIFPAFILNDKNGYAMAKALEAGVLYAAKTVQNGLDTLLDVDRMPEWRLDEIAQEQQCLYDFGADISQKRDWIRNAEVLYRLYGTPSAITKYLESMFDSVRVKEFEQPYHFSVEVDGEWAADREQWILTAIDAVKNERSVLDNVRVRSERKTQIYAGLALRQFGTIALTMAPVEDTGVLGTFILGTDRLS